MKWYERINGMKYLFPKLNTLKSLQKEIGRKGEREDMRQI